MSLIGTHIKAEPNELINETDRMKNMGSNFVQIFANKFSKTATKYYTEFGQYIKLQNIKCVVHSSYTINLARNWDFHSWWLKQLILEIKMADTIGAIYVVVHLGKQLSLSKEMAINNMYTSLIYVLSKTKQYKPKILLETSSGQGSEMFYNLEDLGNFLKKLKKHGKKIGICIDACHVLAAGYDIKEKKNIVKFFEHFNLAIGLENIKLAHLNNSKNDVNSKIDRHANFSNGFIENNSMITMAIFFKDLSIPIILETPSDGVAGDLMEIL